MLVKQAQEIVLQAHEIMKRELRSWTKEVEIFRKALSSSKQIQASLEDELRTTQAKLSELQHQSELQQYAVDSQGHLEGAGM